ncbi:MAG: tetratricopeptide repeat protein [Chitinispirillaceae bacterium]|nr:tetratricopeptide repeat protein [Chitinispirillaceae bacterium]
MRLIKMVRICTIFTCLFVPLLVSSTNAQSDDPFSTESSDWPDFGSESATYDAAPAEPNTVTKKEPLPPPPQATKTVPEAVPEVKPATTSTSSGFSTPASSGSYTSSESSSSKPATSGSTPAASSSSSHSSYTTGSSATSSSGSSEPAQSTRSTYVSSSKALKRAGPPRILVCRPVYAPYTTETKTMYISSITEAYFHFKLNALPGYQVIPQERLANNIQYFRDFTRRISRPNYIDAAQQLGATYLFYVEYEPQGKKVKFNIEFYSIAENKKLVSSIQQIDLGNFEDGLFNCLNEVTSSLPDKFSDDTQKMLGSSILGKNSKPLEVLGNAIASMGDYSKGRAENSAADFEKIANQNSDFHLSKLVASSILTIAQKYDKAIQFLDKLIYEYGGDYPALYLQLASTYRQAQRYNDALDAAEKASRYPGIALLAKTEKARIYEAKGDLKAAKKEYQSVLSSGGEDGEIYFQLALVSIGLNDLSSSSTYLSKAGSAGRKIDRGDYYDIGLRYKNLGTADEKAIDAFKNSLGIQQDKEEAWLQLSEIYSKMGREDEAAECYINLFHINNSAYKDYLPKAGIKFESLGMANRAKEAYSLFVARKYTDPEVSIRLAKLYLADNNCTEATKLVEGLDTNSIYGTDIKKINEHCGVITRVIVMNTNVKQQRKKAAVFMWRVFSGIIAAGGVGAGYIINNQINDKITKYEEKTADYQKFINEPNSGIKIGQIERDRLFIDNLHSEIESFKMYRSICYGAGGIGATSLALSIAIPIIIKK